MFNNIGKKIKVLALIFFILEVTAIEISSLVLMAEGYDEEIVMGIFLMFLGPVVAWVSSWFLYGYGELIAKTAETEKNTRAIYAEIARIRTAVAPAKPATAAKADNARNSNLEKLRAEGLITEEEYKAAIESNI